MAAGDPSFTACTPTFNWREVPLGNEGFVALLPCKAERAQRSLPLGADQVPVDVAGCETGGAIFAIARAQASDGVQAAAWLSAWQSASRQRLAGRRLVEDSSGPPRAAPQPGLPACTRPTIRRASSSASEGPPQAHMQWFALGLAGGGMAIFRRPSPEVRFRTRSCRASSMACVCLEAGGR